LRERLALDGAALSPALQALTASELVDEAVILSTCNRTEYYLDAKDMPKGLAVLRDFICSFYGLDEREYASLRPHFYFKQGKEAVEHLFTVVASLDSQVLGEAQILGQVRTAFAAASAAGAVAKVFDKLFKQAIEVGRLVRTDTAIGAQSVSISTAAVNLVHQVYDKLSDLNVLLLGTGQMGRLAAQYLAEKGVPQLFLSSRHLDHAQALAEEMQGALRQGGSAVAALPIEDLAQSLHRADVTISCTSASGYVIGPAMVREARRRRHGRPLLLIDIALPRDVDPAVGEISDVFLYDLDDLGVMVDDNLKTRAGEAKKAEQIVAEQVDAFLSWIQAEQVTPTIKDLNQKLTMYAERERDRAAKALRGQHGGQPLTAAEQGVLDAMAASIVKKIMHGPMMRLRSQAGNPDSYRYTEACRYLFGLDVNPSGKPHRCHVKPERLCQVDQGQPCDIPDGAGCGRRVARGPQGQSTTAGKTVKTK
jgi:glutamyl-tRNA reductase